VIERGKDQLGSVGARFLLGIDNYGPATPVEGNDGIHFDVVAGLGAELQHCLGFLDAKYQRNLLVDLGRWRIATPTRSVVVVLVLLLIIIIAPLLTSPSTCSSRHLPIISPTVLYKFIEGDASFRLEDGRGCCIQNGILRGGGGGSPTARRRYDGIAVMKARGGYRPTNIINGKCYLCGSLQRVEETSQYGGRRDELGTTRSRCHGCHAIGIRYVDPMNYLHGAARLDVFGHEFER